MNTSSKTTDIIGLAGTFASGKDTIGHKLAEDHGYTHVSLGDMVRKVAQEKFGSIERPILHSTARDFRYQHGAGAFVKEALKEPRPTVVSGIRTLGEAKALLEAGGTLVFVDAPLEIRFERVKSRNRDKETELTLEEFKANEQKEMYAGPNDEDFNIRGIKQLADIVVENTLLLDEFIAHVYDKLGLQ